MSAPSRTTSARPDRAPRTHRARRSVAGVLAVLCGVLATPAAVLVAPTPAAAESGDRITAYTTALDVRPDGTVAVTETIDYDFGTATGRHGIERRVRTRLDWPGGKDRSRPVSDVTASSSTGAPTDVVVGAGGDDTTLRIGDPARTVTGRQQYTIRYVLRGAVVDTAGVQRLEWTVRAAEWSGATLAGVRITATLPEAATGTCQPAGTCTLTGEGTGTLVASTDTLGTSGQVGLRADLPAGTVDGAAPILVDPPSRGPVFLIGGIFAFVGLIFLVVFVGIVIAIVRAVSGAGRRAPTSGWAGAAGGSTGPPAAVPAGVAALAGAPPPAPPTVSAAPALVGLVTDRKPEGRHLAAILVDLSRRGIVAIEPVAGRRGPDWSLSPGSASPLGAEPYEQELVDALLGRGPVPLSGLASRRSAVRGVTRSVLAAGREQGLVRTTGATVRRVVGGGLVVVGLGLFALVFLGGVGGAAGRFDLPEPLTGAAAPVLAVPAMALAILGSALGRWRRVGLTPAGRDLARQAKELRAYLTAGTGAARRSHDADAEYARMLPYAVALGVEGPWSEAFRWAWGTRAPQLAGLAGLAGLAAVGGGVLAAALADMARATTSSMSSLSSSTSTWTGGSSGDSGGSSSSSGGDSGGGGSW